MVVVSERNIDIPKLLSSLDYNIKKSKGHKVEINVQQLIDCSDVIKTYYSREEDDNK